MSDLHAKNKDLNITLSTDLLTQTQVRLIKNLNALVAHVLTAEDEAEYFDSSAELIKKTVEIIKHAQFATENKQINYGEQAAEYAVDFLNDSLVNMPHNIDN